MDARNSGALAREAGRFQPAAFAKRTKQYQSPDQYHRARHAQNEKVRMLVIQRVRVRCPGFMSLSGRQQSEPAGETEKLFHTLIMLWPGPEKSSLGLARSWSQRFGSPSPFPSPPGEGTPNLRAGKTRGTLNVSPSPALRAPSPPRRGRGKGEGAAGWFKGARRAQRFGEISPQGGGSR